MPGRLAYSADIVVRHAQKAGKQRLKAVLLGWIASCGERGNGAAVKAVFHHHNLRLCNLPAMAVQPCQLKGGLVGFSTRVAKEGAAHARQRTQALAQLLLPVDAKDIGGV